MEELKDVSIHHTALKILTEITSMKSYDETIYKTVQVFYKRHSHMFSFSLILTLYYCCFETFHTTRN